MNDDGRREAGLKLAQVRALIAEAGRMEQSERSKLGVPPRAVLRAALNVGKRGRKGAKARAKVARAAAKQGLV